MDVERQRSREVKVGRYRIGRYREVERVQAWVQTVPAMRCLVDLELKPRVSEIFQPAVISIFAIGEDGPLIGKLREMRRSMRLSKPNR